MTRDLEYDQQTMDQIAAEAELAQEQAGFASDPDYQKSLQCADPDYPFGVPGPTAQKEPATWSQKNYYQKLAKRADEKGIPTPVLNGQETKEEMTAIIAALKEIADPGERGLSVTEPQKALLTKLRDKAIQRNVPYDPDLPKTRAQASLMIRTLSDKLAAATPANDALKTNETTTPAGEQLLQRLRKVWMNANGQQRNVILGIVKNVKIRDKKQQQQLISQKEDAYVAKLEHSPVLNESTPR